MKKKRLYKPKMNWKAYLSGLVWKWLGWNVAFFAGTIYGSIVGTLTTYALCHQ